MYLREHQSYFNVALFPSVLDLPQFVVHVNSLGVNIHRVLTKEWCGFKSKRVPSAAATVQVSAALPAFCFSCLLRGRGTCFQDGVEAGKGFLCAPF
jgi:hypothetical protein